MKMQKSFFISKKVNDVIALGELLIDFINNGVSEQGNNTFEACPGGAICNVLAMLAKLGKSCAFIGNEKHYLYGKPVQVMFNIQETG